MPSSINASTTAGLVNTADTSGVLQLQTAGVTAISIDASQAVSFTNSPTVTGGTANGVAYLNGSKVLTTGSALVFDGTNSRLSINQSSSIFGAQLEVTASTGGQAVGIHGRSADGLANIVFGANGAGTEYARIQSDNTSSLQFGAGSTGATKMTLTSNGVLALSGASTSATGVGITFPATQSASSDANTLDDYEEGTITGLTDGSGAGLSITFNNAKYTKIGRLVYVSISTIVYPTTSSTAPAIIAGLPFTNTAADVASSALVTNSASANRALVVSNSTTIFFYPTASAGQALNNQLSGTVIYGFSAVYQV